MEHNNTNAILDYLVYRQYRSNIFFNLSVILFGALVTKVASNFAFGEPGFAGFRVSLQDTFTNFISVQFQDQMVLKPNI